MPEFPDNLPEKWKNKGYNVCRLGIDCYGISNLKILNISDRGIFSLKIKKEGDHFQLQATNENSLLELNAKSIFLCDPNAYTKDNK
ncbi:Imm50 family immunity protein [Edaphovirga cremea]|uniref:Imm50 family immunity protein n=1 Tax=Edaphovirga cremea TaxID=2267246 RepID=UPI003989AA44